MRNFWRHFENTLGCQSKRSSESVMNSDQTDGGWPNFTTAAKFHNPGILGIPAVRAVSQFLRCFDNISHFCLFIQFKNKHWTFSFSQFLRWDENVLASARAASCPACGSDQCATLSRACHTITWAATGFPGGEIVELAVLKFWQLFHEFMESAT